MRTGTVRVRSWRKHATQCLSLTSRKGPGAISDGNLQSGHPPHFKKPPLDGFFNGYKKIPQTRGIFVFCGYINQPVSARWSFSCPAAFYGDDAAHSLLSFSRPHAVRFSFLRRWTARARSANHRSCSVPAQRAV